MRGTVSQWNYLAHYEEWLIKATTSQPVRAFHCSHTLLLCGHSSAVTSVRYAMTSRVHAAPYDVPYIQSRVAQGLQNKSHEYI